MSTTGVPASPATELEQALPPSSGSTVEERGSRAPAVAVNARIVGAGLNHAASARWAIDAVADLPWPVFASASAADGPRSVAMAADAGSVIVCQFSRGGVGCDVHARTAESAAARLAEVRRLLPASPTARDDTVVVSFWSNGRDQVSPLRRRVGVPRWSEIETNYHEATRRQLARLMQLRPGVAAGKLILWHGLPGTGKTWALRALAREWSEWASLHYITDPEQFFGGSVDYMMRVLLDGDDEDEQDDETSAQGSAPEWRLLVMEDTGELLTRDAKREVGQGLSRLLNVCDGLMGQGLRLVVLITSNEDVGAMHPAVTRHGRTLASVRFDPLDPDEVARWAAAHEAGTPPRGVVLADLFAGDDGEQQRSSRPIGFRPPERP